MKGLFQEGWPKRREAPKTRTKTRTPLNRPRADILKEVGKPFYQTPKWMLTGPNHRSIHKHCYFHETHDHNTKDCMSLKYFLEEQVEKWNMNQYLNRRDMPRRDNIYGPKNVVNMIKGGGGGDNHHQAQTHARMWWWICGVSGWTYAMKTHSMVWATI